MPKIKKQKPLLSFTCTVTDKKTARWSMELVGDFESHTPEEIDAFIEMAYRQFSTLIEKTVNQIGEKLSGE